MMDNLFFIDAETRRPQSQVVRDYVRANGKVDARLKDPAKIEAARDKLLADTPLNPLWGELAVVCCEEPLGLFTHCADGPVTERDLLAGLNDHLRKRRADLNGRLPHFVGFNVGFDLRFLWTRMLVNGITPAVPIPFDAKPWSGKYTDLRYALTGGDMTAKGTLQDWVVALGGKPREGDIPGKAVPDAIEAGRMTEVVAHCQLDVRDCVFLHNRLIGRR